MITSLDLFLAKEGGKNIKVIIDMITTLNLTLDKEGGKNQGWNRYDIGSVPVETYSGNWIWPRSIFVIGSDL